MTQKEKIRQQADKYIGQPYQCPNRQLACILLVLDILAPHLAEAAKIRERLDRFEVTSKKSLIEQDYFRKFIRTTALQWVKFQQLAPGDILLLWEYSKARRIDHLGVYLGDGEYLHLHRERARHDRAVVVRLDENRQKILGIVRAKQ